MSGPIRAFFAVLILIVAVGFAFYQFSFKPYLEMTEARSDLKDTPRDLDKRVRLLHIILKYDPDDLSANIMLARTESELSCQSRGLEALRQSQRKLNQWCGKARRENQRVAEDLKFFCGTEDWEELWQKHHREAESMLQEIQQMTRQMEGMWMSSGSSANNMSSAFERIFKAHQYKILESHPEDMVTDEMRRATLVVEAAGPRENMRKCLQAVSKVMTTQSIHSTALQIDLTTPRMASFDLELEGILSSDTLSPRHLEKIVEAHQKLTTGIESVYQDDRYFDFYDHYNQLMELKSAYQSAAGIIHPSPGKDMWKMVWRILSSPEGVEMRMMLWAPDYMLAVQGRGGNETLLNRWIEQISAQAPDLPAARLVDPAPNDPKGWQILFEY